MTAEWVIELTREALWLTLLLGGPFLAVALILGLSISILQAATQINEMTLSFVPKLFGIGFCIWISAGWMIRQWTTFTTEVMLLIGSGAFP